MAVRGIEIGQYEQDFNVPKDKKHEYGEIYTPFFLIKRMLDMLPDAAFTDKTAKWLDPGAGTGYFSMYLYHKLWEGLNKEIADPNLRHNHIVSKMLYMVEIQESNCQTLLSVFGNEANVTQGDFLTMKSEQSFDYVLGNPPYNARGLKKVPTNKIKDKKQDGKTVWVSFIKKSISLLRSRGKLLFIVPSIWMKPDRARTYHYLTGFNLEKIRCLTNTQTNSVFKGEAQTPTCFFLLSKEPAGQVVKLFDEDRNQYVQYPLVPEEPLPVFGQSIIAKMRPYVLQAGSIDASKTNLPSKGSHFSKTRDKQHPYPNVRTCILEGLEPRISTDYSNSPQAYNGKRKLILAHKMYGFPVIDRDGAFGISNRDNYVICRESLEDLERLKRFFGTKTALYLFEATRYRMKYLEKYAFQLIPDITKLDNFPETINDETIADFFGFDSVDRENIQSLHRKKYTFFPELPIL